MKYRKKPVEVEAIRASVVINDAKHNWDHLPGWLRDAYEKGHIQFRAKSFDSGGAVYVNMIEGSAIAHPEDWIVCGSEGEIYMCTPEIFAATYEQA